MKVNSVRHTAIRSACLVLGLAVSLFTSEAVAQSPVLKASIPFDFYVSGKLMPAGTYVVNTIANRGGIQISGDEGSGITLLTTPVANPNPGRSFLSFHRYGDTYFLTEVNWEGYGSGHGLFESKLERQTRNGNPPVRTILHAGR